MVLAAACLRAEPPPASPTRGRPAQKCTVRQGGGGGLSAEFKPPGSFAPVSDIVGGGPFGLEPGQWTDDTSMALCLAESLVERRGFDARDQLERYLRWMEQGHLSSTGSCFDIGRTTKAALKTFKLKGDAECGRTEPHAAGNGSIMRLAPVPLAYFRDPKEAVRLSGLSSKTTHALPVAVDACRYLGGLIAGAVAGASKEELLSERYSPVPGLWEAEPLEEQIDAVAAGSFKRRHPPEIRGAGYVVASLEAALWAFHRAADFRDGACLAVNLGDDADTTGAVYGQVAGAFYGEEAIPASWRARLAMGELIIDLADRLFDLSSELAGRARGSQ